MATISIDYGKFTLKAGQLSGVWTARAFLRNGPGGHGFAHQATGKDASAALDALRRSTTRPPAAGARGAMTPPRALTCRRARIMSTGCAGRP